ncbi:MAG: dTDP-4-dehydrorhamnose 3,5-epimerase family protein [Acidobacteriia bacterium]|nr:dTDP-4-dehydrorhamnose 3,5-epimerase family protein [Terriglobia bacterium]
MIDGVRVKTLKVISDERGRLMEVLRNDDDLFIKFGQIYITTAYPGVVKGWHYHKKQIDNFVVARGMMKLVLYDSRKKSKTFGEINEFFMGEHNPILVQIPAWVFHGFKCVSESECVVVNTPTEVYHYKKPDEFRVPYKSRKIPYDWGIKMG